MLPAERSTTHDPFGTGLPSDIFDAAVRRINDIVVVTEADPLAAPDYRVLFVNPAFERISGYAPREIIGKSLKVLRGPGTSHEALAHLDAMLSQRKTARTELLNYRDRPLPISEHPAPRDCDYY